MSLRRFWAVAHKEFRHVQRDRRLLFLVTVSPAIMLVTFAYLFSFDSSSAQLAIFDRDRSPQSRGLLQAIGADSDLVVVGEARAYDELRSAMQAGKIKVGVVIPPGFGQKLVAGETAEVQIVGDGSDPINSSVQMARLSSRISDWAAPYRRVDARLPIEVRDLAWFNPDLKSSHSMVPALLAIVLILPGMAVALALTREKELGSFEGLAATPVQAGEYILGKLIPYIVYGLVGAAGAVAVALLWFQTPFRGGALNLVAMIAIYLWATLGISILLAGFMATQSTALRAVLLLFLVPSLFLSGILLPVDPSARLTANSLPATHFVTISRGLFLKGLGWQALGPSVFTLLMMGLGSIVLAVVTFRKRVG